MPIMVLVSGRALWLNFFFYLTMVLCRKGALIDYKLLCFEILFNTLLHRYSF